MEEDVTTFGPYTEFWLSAFLSPLLGLLELIQSIISHLRLVYDRCYQIYWSIRPV